MSNVIIFERGSITMQQGLTPIEDAELYMGSSGDMSLAALLEKTTIASSLSSGSSYQAVLR